MDLKDATILVVDDEPDWRSIIADWLRREGSCVLLAEDGAEALKLIHTNKIDAVVSDVRMPVMDGITLLKNIKAGDGYKPSVMFISGFTDIEPGEAYDLGIEAMMAKPVERKHLISAVARILAEREELWSLSPSDKAEALLDANFDNLATALQERLIAFGRGGFCIRSALNLREGPIDLLLNFETEKRRVTGRGIVRWTAAAKAEIGVEIMYIDDDNRAWIISLTGPNTSLSFIPRSIPQASMPMNARV
jgi:two-component system chemotaxis response regulator CheY